MEQHPLYCWWEFKLLQPLWRTVWRFLKILKVELPYDPTIPLLGIYPEKTIIQKDTCTSVLIAASTHIINFIKNIWSLLQRKHYSQSHTHTHTHTHTKKNKIMSLAATWMDLKIIKQSEVSQTKTNIIWYHLHVDSYNEVNELVYKT